MKTTTVSTPNVSPLIVHGAQSTESTQEPKKSSLSDLPRFVWPVNFGAGNWRAKSYIAAIDKQLAHLPDEKKVPIKKMMLAWLEQPGTAETISLQKVQASYTPVTKEDCRPGDILIRKEWPPESVAHAGTLPRQGVRGHNGIEDNRGDTNCFHASMWVQNPTNPKKTSEDGPGQAEQSEARGGLGTTNAMRMQNSAMQPGQYWIYRPTNVLLGEASAQVMQMWADPDNPVKYSTTVLGSTMYPNGVFREFTAEAKSDAATVGADPFTNNPAQMGNLKSDQVYEHVRSTENEESMKANPNAKPKPTTRKPGESCSSAVVRAYQAAQVQLKLATLMEEHQKKLASSDEHAETQFAPQEYDSLVTEFVSEFTGLLANNAEGVSPKTLEHFCRTGMYPDGKPQFEFVGVLTVKPEDVLYAEGRYHPPGHPQAGQRSDREPAV